MIEFIEAIDIAGRTSGQEALIASAEFNMFRGAIIAALFVGLAFLAGFAVLRRGALSYSAAFMVGTAAALEMFWLGLFAVPSSALIVLLQGVFAASVIIFLSASVTLARNNAALGGIMFAASLVFIGVGIINFLGRADFSGLMLRGLGAVGVFALGLSAVQAMRGDHGARLILPGALMAAAAVFLFATTGGGGLLGHGLFTLGILTASLVALTDKVGLHLGDYPSAADAFHGDPVQAFSDKQIDDKALNVSQKQSAGLFSAASSDDKTGVCALDRNKAGRKPAISSERLLEVLDFSGIGVWDWSLDGVYQSRSLCSMLGSDCEADFTPEAMRAFVNPSHLSVFEKEVLGHSSGDGGFDSVIQIHDGRLIRVRGARAVDNNGRLERVVAFFESQSEEAGAGKSGGEAINVSQIIPNLHADDSIANVDEKPEAALQAAGLTPARTSVSNKNALPANALNIALSFSPVMAFVSKEIIGYRIAAPADTKLSLGGNIYSVIGMAASFLADEHQEARKSSAIKRLSSDAYIAMPVSWDDINRAGFLEELQGAIRNHGMPYGSLVLELSGLSGIRDSRGAKALFSQLRQTGARIAFADPDADSAVLGNLHRYDFDYIRMDEGYVDGLNGSDSSGKRAKTLITLGRDLGLRVIASGIETEKSFSKLRRLGCTHGDGSILGTPVNKTSETNETPADASQQFQAPDNNATDNSARSLDEWSRTGSSGKDGKGTKSDPLPSLQAAFENSVPSFEAEPRSELAEETAPARDSKLPKWRTWGRQMR